MPNQRAPGQKFVGAFLDQEMLAALDKARTQNFPIMDRSTWVREAIYAKLDAMQIHLPAHLVSAPDRTGKSYRDVTAEMPSAMVAEDGINASKTQVVKNNKAKRDMKISQ